MSNRNPIYVDTEPVRTVFKINASYQHQNLKVTVEYLVKDEGWIYGGTNYLFLNREYIFKSDSIEPVKEKIGIVSSLNGSEFKVKSRIFLFYPAGGAIKAPVITTKISFFIDGDLLESFDSPSNGSYFTSFNSWIRFEMV
ncbi:hypothetical protein EA772_15390 [Pedobacter sp. G11]|uniref:hypothetical protein n=1 Tax=Pedobacter sp. G11 TaxID=2482728 RepID=UPI000F5E4147|nr:hypothetical protein [Pedobacter sp. G11]AZI26657.1 hypothetical protein EA772_15390 [Pedobacter sp. G11]